MTDYDNIDQDFDITGRPDVSAVELRRARLGVEGVVWYDVKYKFEADFADNEVAIKDAYVAYAGLKPKDWGHRRNQVRQSVRLQLARGDHELALHHLHGARGLPGGVLP